jgi:hypothetical protein
MKEDYSDLDVDQIVKEVYAAVDEGRTRPGIKQESMLVRVTAPVNIPASCYLAARFLPNQDLTR